MFKHWPNIDCSVNSIDVKSYSDCIYSIFQRPDLKYEIVQTSLPFFGAYYNWNYKCRPIIDILPITKWWINTGYYRGFIYRNRCYYYWTTIRVSELYFWRETSFKLWWYTPTPYRWLAGHMGQYHPFLHVVGFLIYSMFKFITL